MARTGMNVDPNKLQSVITELEDSRIATGNPFRSRNELFKEVAESDWGKSIGLTPVMVYIRVDKLNLHCKTSEKKRSQTQAEPGDIGPKVRNSSLIRHGIDFDDFFRVFESQGITVDGLASIMVNSMNPPDLNFKIRSAWGILRTKYAIPKFTNSEIQENSSENVSTPQSIEEQTEDQNRIETTENYLDDLQAGEQRQDDSESLSHQDLDPLTKNQIVEVTETDPSVVD